MSFFRTATPRFVSKPLLAAPRVAAFHASKKLQILPAGPRMLSRPHIIPIAVANTQQR
jgi:hypothetical protein